MTGYSAKPNMMFLFFFRQAYTKKARFYKSGLFSCKINKHLFRFAERIVAGFAAGTDIAVSHFNGF